MNKQGDDTDQVELEAPLSFAQQRLWLLDRLLPTGSVYNIEQILRLSGELDHPALRRALNELVRRHEVLRTRFGMQDGQPVQVITPELKIALAIEDLLEYAPYERASEAKRRAQAEAEAPFNLMRGPLIRARLLRLAHSEHWLLLTMHHIVTDGWSSGVLRRELTALYNAYHRGEASPLPELPVQYADYALWQRQWLQGAVLEQQLEYWRQALSDLPILDLPTDRPRPATASYRGGCVKFEVPESLTRSLKDLSRREGATLFMTLLAAYQILLFRYSGQEDIAVGIPIAGRTRLELEGLIGFFVNTLVLRGDLSGEPSFKTHLAQVLTRALDAYAHQDLPFEKLVEDLAPKRDLSRNPLFQASLVLQNTPPGHWQLPGLKVQRVEGIRSATAKFDLAMSLTESGGKLMGSLGYATDLFETATIERMAGHFLRLLSGIAADPECRIGELPLLTAAERHQLLVEWNATAVAYPRDQCIQQLFEQQVERTPDAPAVVFGEQQLTYRELDARANQLAHHLRFLGVGPEVLVGLCLERSLELIVGLLAILKAGGAYVPLDPRYPEERMRFILEDTGAPVVLTLSALLPLRPESGVRSVCLDHDGPTIDAQSAQALVCEGDAKNPAYVIYTSGSTGTPKGVPITHENLFNLVCWHQRAYGVTAADRATQIAGPAFDASVWEIWPYLTAGASVHIPDDATRMDAGALVRWLAEQRITLAFLPTPLCEAVLREDWPKPTALRAMLTGGDRLNRRPAQALPFRLVNHYGPTENTVVSTCAEVQPGSMTAPPIGRPLPNTRAYVVNAKLQPAPIGVAGELLVGGAQLAFGYLNRPELTTEKFIADPFRPGERVYHTGDLVRFLADGNIEFIGRIDQQVKLRGIRIELGEIEATLARHPEVREAAVVLGEDLPGDQRLVAYCVARDGDLVVADLRAWLKRQLPDYMVPAAFVVLPALPLTPNGKVNRKELLVPENEISEPAHELPTTPIESIIAEIWTNVLNRQRVNIDDDFFDLGGHSLLAVRLMSRINQALEVDLNLRQLFETPTVRGLALAALDAMVAGADEDVALHGAGAIP